MVSCTQRVPAGTRLLEPNLLHSCAWPAYAERGSQFIESPAQTWSSSRRHRCLCRESRYRRSSARDRTPWPSNFTSDTGGTRVGTGGLERMIARVGTRTAKTMRPIATGEWGSCWHLRGFGGSCNPILRGAKRVRCAWSVAEVAVSLCSPTVCTIYAHTHTQTLFLAHVPPWHSYTKSMCSAYESAAHTPARMHTPCTHANTQARTRTRAHECVWGACARACVNVPKISMTIA